MQNRTKFLLSAVALVALSVGTVQQASSQTSIFGTNLVVNGDAEQGLNGWSSGSPTTNGDGQTGTPAMPVVVNYGSGPAYPDYSSQGPSVRGDHLFVCQRTVFPDGTVGWGGTAFQTIDVSSAATQIDAGNVQMVCSAWTGGWGNKFSTASLTFRCRDEADGQAWDGVYNITNPPSFAPLRNYQTGMIYRSGTFRVPPGARKIVVQMTIEGQEANGSGPLPGTPAYVDNVSVVLVQN